MTAGVRRNATWLVIGLVVIAAIWTKVRLEAGMTLERAVEFERVSYTRLAIISYRHTVRWYSPGSGPVEVAVHRLETLGDELAANGKPGLALEAYRALRSGIFAIRSFYSPYVEKLPELHRKIAELMAQQEAEMANETDISARVAHHQALLSVDHAPNVFWSLLATFGFALWCGCLLMLSQRGFDDSDGSLKRPAALRWGLSVLVTLAVWVTALFFA